MGSLLYARRAGLLFLSLSEYYTIFAACFKAFSSFHQKKAEAVLRLGLVGQRFHRHAVGPGGGEHVDAAGLHGGCLLYTSSLLLCGNAGLGKTHAALAIAQTVLEKGFDVVYISAQSLFGQLERDRFADDCPLMEAVLEADLLVLDDLGTEYVSPYVLSCFYNLLNTRLLEKRPTVYTTNIVDGKAFEARYTEKIASRLGGSCEPVLFLGQDIRKLKSME